jgi:hypothetical protein
MRVEKGGAARCCPFFSVYFFLALAFALAFGFASFMGTPQQIRSQGAQAQGSSTTTTTPHSSHSNFCPFRAILSPPLLFIIRKDGRLPIKNYAAHVS